jgi:hypothetical protein
MSPTGTSIFWELARQLDRHEGAQPGHGFDVDVSAMSVDSLVRDGEAESRAALATRKERRPDPSEDMPGNSGTLVAHGPEQSTVAALSARQEDDSSRWARFNRVDHDISKRLDELAGIPAHVPDPI